MTTLEEFKRFLDKKGTTAFKFVKIRAVRTCAHCLKAQPIGTSCLTVNKRYSPRCWYCENCVQLLLNVNEARVHRRNVAFGDEGAELAFIEWEDEALQALEEARG